MANFLEASHEFVYGNMLAGISTEKILEKHQFIPGFEHRKTPERFAGFLDELRKTLN